MIPFIDFNQATPVRDIFYDGDAGAKKTINYNNDIWMLKLPKSTRDYKTRQISYTTSPLSEYLGSRIYEILGIPVHETLLGHYQGKVVVACKDFTYENGKEIARLISFNKIKNSYMSSDLDSNSGTGSETLLEEVLETISGQENLQEIKQTAERFWDMFVVDAFIGNNDRNNGNWGLLLYTGTGKQTLAPVYDNGNAFFNKRGIAQMEKRIANIDLLREDAYRAPVCAFKYLDSNNQAHKINPFDFIKSQDNPECNAALLRFMRRVDMASIDQLINDIPEVSEGIVVMPLAQKEFYKAILSTRLNEVFAPTAQQIIKECSGKEQRISLNNEVRKAQAASQELNERDSDEIIPDHNR